MKRLKNIGPRVLKPVVAKQIPVTAYYTGDNGTYCSVLPTGASVDRINELVAVLQASGFEAHVPLNYHVTVIHSKTGMDLAEQQEAWGALRADKIFEAVPRHVTHWSGHDGTGFIVLELDAPQLAEIHEYMKTTFGLKTTFPDYRAHVTLVEDAYDDKDEDNLEVQAVVNRLNQMLGTEPAPLTFTGIRLEDLKK